MKESRASWMRIAGILALSGTVLAAGLLSPVGAKSSVSRGFVRKLVNRKIEAMTRALEVSIRETRMNASSTQRVGAFALAGSATDVIVSTLSIPDAGHYVVTAKLWWNVISSTSTGVGGEVDCDLLAEGSFDTSRESGVTDFDYGTLSLQLTHTFGGPSTVTLRCRDEFGGGNPVEVHNVVITAVEVFALGSTRVDRETPREPPTDIQRP